jgi:Tol biopolymer transport system component/DNA-binding winged helix-turn-helix (wHTH) protein
VAQQARTTAKYRFGTFELDRRSAELRKRGLRIKLQDQPYRILCLLLDRPGEVITRETLCAALWPADTFVAFERSLNAAIAKLRQALGDSAENPRFIETVARHGYRFIAPIEGIQSLEQTPDVGVQIASATPIKAENDTEVAGQSRREHSKKLGILGAAIAVVLVAGGVVVTLRLHSKIAAPIPDMTRLTFDSGLTTDPAVSPDGKLLAYASDRSGNGRLHIWVQQLIPDGQAVQLTRGDVDDHQPTFSPDGSRIAFRSERDGGGIFVIPAIGGEAILIAKDGRDPRFSPDGRWIAYWQAVMMASPFAANAGTVHLAPSEGGPSRSIAANLVEAGVPVWSEDGKRLLVYGHSDDSVPSDANWNWWVVPFDGSSAVSTGAFEVLTRKGFSIGLDAPRVAKWAGDQLLFFGRVGDTVNVWTIHIDGSNSRVRGDPQKLTSGAGVDAYPSVTTDGRLLFAGLTSSSDVWILPMDTNKPNVPGPPLRATETIGPHRGASLSLDGKLLAYSSKRYGRSQTEIRDLDRGIDIPVPGKAEGLVQLSPDGSLLVYNTGNLDRKGLSVRVRGGATDQFCTDCNSPYDISPDNNVVLYRKDKVIRAFALASHRDVLFMKRDGYQLFQHKFSPDGRWVTFEAVHQGRSRLYIAALRNLITPAPEGEWISVTSDEGWADKPRWSPDGNTIYFISNRDGFFCLWAQRIAHDSKRPIGGPMPVAHFHGSRLSMANIGPGGVMQISVAKDKIAFNLGELTGNIWATSLPR